MEDMLFWVELIIVVFGVLQIILFFKLWRMTNDVHKMKEKSLRNSLLNDSKILFLKGDKEAAYNTLLKSFLQDIIISSASTGTSHPENDYKVDYRNLLEQYKPIFERIGFGHPDYSLYNELHKVNI